LRTGRASGDLGEEKEKMREDPETNFAENVMKAGGGEVRSTQNPLVGPY